MTHTKKVSIVAIISFLVVIGFTVPATTYAYGGNTQPRAVEVGKTAR